ncbi:MAG: putative molybdenum carrier protein [Deltaproteobacteria bacterium]|nr:putative molybdenum carrier protein [Deltaproteobacteria bacterium]MBW2099516.1 putative molybdenum carrier protein [Deltaproteobacteria bacterium]
MIKKIISGGQTGADQAALDVAIMLDIPHGGWIPKGRKTEKGRLPDKYKLKEMPTSSYPKRTERNILDSDGTLIISRGKLTGGSALTQNLSNKHNRPCIHIDLNQTIEFEAVVEINAWVMENNIEVLNVAGPRESEDRQIYKSTMGILKSVFLLSLTHNKSSAKIQTLSPAVNLPKTVDEAVRRLVSEVPLKDRVMIANMAEGNLDSLDLTLGPYISNTYGLCAENRELMESCRLLSGNDGLNEDEAYSIIINELWKKLRETHTLKIIKS